MYKLDEYDNLLNEYGKTVKEKQDLEQKLKEARISEEAVELEARRAKWVCPEPKIKTGYAARYAKLVTSADKGAVLM